jgi:hypothetical protein
MRLIPPWWRTVARWLVLWPLWERQPYPQRVKMMAAAPRQLRLPPDSRHPYEQLAIGHDPRRVRASLLRLRRSNSQVGKA